MTKGPTKKGNEKGGRGEVGPCDRPGDLVSSKAMASDWRPGREQGEESPGTGPQRSLEGGLPGMGHSPGRQVSRPLAGCRGRSHVSPRAAVRNKPWRQASTGRGEAGGPAGSSWGLVAWPALLCTAGAKPAGASVLTARLPIWGAMKRHAQGLWDRGTGAVAELRARF